MLACTHPAFDGPVILFQDVIKILHGVTAKMQHFQEVSSSMIAALFLIETAKSELEDAGLPQAEAVSKASDILAETTEKIGHVIGEADRHSE
jgi:hypothetical protein